MKYFNSNAVFQIFIITLGAKVLQGFNFVYLDSILFDFLFFFVLSVTDWLVLVL